MASRVLTDSMVFRVSMASTPTSHPQVLLTASRDLTESTPSSPAQAPSTESRVSMASTVSRDSTESRDRVSRESMASMASRDSTDSVESVDSTELLVPVSVESVDSTELLVPVSVDSVEHQASVEHQDSVEDSVDLSVASAVAVVSQEPLEPELLLGLVAPLASSVTSLANPLPTLVASTPLTPNPLEESVVPTPHLSVASVATPSEDLINSPTVVISVRSVMPVTSEAASTPSVEERALPTTVDLTAPRALTAPAPVTDRDTDSSPTVTATATRDMDRNHLDTDRDHLDTATRATATDGDYLSEVVSYAHELSVHCLTYVH